MKNWKHLGVRGGGSVPHVHVPTADPLRARRDADLVRPSIETGGSTGRVGPCPWSSQGSTRFQATGGAASAVDRVVPVVVVVGRRAVPASVLGLERVVRPAHTGVLVRDHDPCPVKPSVHTPGACTWFTPGSTVSGEWALCGGIYAVEPVRLRVRLDRAHVRASGEGFDEPSVALRDNDVRDPKDVLDTPREASIALSDACVRTACDLRVS